MKGAMNRSGMGFER